MVEGRTNTRISEYLLDSPTESRFSEEKYILFLQGITAVFDGFKALDIEALGIEHNELRVIIGPNGAGKTTMCDIISGKTRPTTGSVYFEGQNITETTETGIALLGIGRKFQTPTVFDSLTTFKIWNSLYLIIRAGSPICIVRFPRRKTTRSYRFWSGLGSKMSCIPKLNT